VLLDLVLDLDEMEKLATVNMVIEILKGRKVKKDCFGDHLIGKHLGNLKHLSEGDLRRLVLRMLDQRILKEKYVS